MTDAKPFNNTARLTLNSRLKNTKSPKYNGLLMANNVTFQASAWEKKTPGTGAPFLSVNLIEKSDTEEGYSSRGRGKISIYPNTEVGGTLEIEDTIWQVTGHYQDSVIKLTLTEEEKDEVLITVSLPKEEADKLEEIAKSYEASTEALVGRLIKRFLASAQK